MLFVGADAPPIGRVLGSPGKRHPRFLRSRGHQGWRARCLVLRQWRASLRTRAKGAASDRAWGSRCGLGLLGFTKPPPIAGVCIFDCESLAGSVYKLGRASFVQATWRWCEAVRCYCRGGLWVL